MTIKEKYPELDFQVTECKQALIKSQIFEPTIILNGSGAPQQEFWIAENLDRIPSVKIAVGVGGTFDFISGMKKRAPKFLRSFGLEWFWRLLKQPNRIVRIFRAVILFPILVIKNKYDKN
jgi:N-acetylglucosaminyldiphosphoundecaprenol N-acetyl-beta-D-mannosaminyltransferase